MVDSPGAMNKVSAVPEIKPLHQYDFSRAKICASVRWLLSKWFGSAGTSLREAAWVGRDDQPRELFQSEVWLKQPEASGCGDRPSAASILRGGFC